MSFLRIASFPRSTFLPCPTYTSTFLSCADGQPGAYDQALKGIEGIINVASPVDINNPGDPSLVIDPAVNGVKGLLNSMGPSVKRVVHIR